MRNKYYYLVASLPHLSFDNTDLMTSGRFLEECERWLTVKDMDVLRSLNINDPFPGENDPEVVRRWKDFDRSTRTIIAGMRTQDKRAAAGENLYFSREKIEGKDPFNAEKTIIKAGWDYVSGEELQYMFDMNRLVLYYIKVQLLERLGQFDKEKGDITFKQCCEVKDEQKDW